MANKIYQLQYDDEIDRDIHEWINSFPRNRKAEMVRTAIRFYIHATKGSAMPIIPVVPVAAQTEQQAEQPKRNRKRPALPKDESELNEKSAE